MVHFCHTKYNTCIIHHCLLGLYTHLLTPSVYSAAILELLTLFGAVQDGHKFLTFKFFFRLTTTIIIACQLRSRISSYSIAHLSTACRIFEFGPSYRHAIPDFSHRDTPRHITIENFRHYCDRRDRFEMRFYKSKA